jgi:hypothetical protein
MEIPGGSLEGSVFLAGRRITISALIAICEAFARENFQLFSQLALVAGEAKPSEVSDLVPLLREIIQGHIPNTINLSPQEYQNPADISLPPPPPPPNIKTRSQIEYEEACRVAEEMDRKEREIECRLREEAEERDLLEAQKLAQQLEEEYQASISFYCQICMDNHPVHGSYTLECGHRFCEEAISGYICSKINSHEVNDDVMVCPLAECGIPIHHTIIRGCTKELQNSDAYEKYCEFRKDTFIQDEIQRGCMLRCPTEHCNYVFSYALNSSRPLPFTCESCHISYCINCRVLDHPALHTASPTPTPPTRGHFGPGHPPHSCEKQVEKLLRDAEERKKLEEWRVLNANAQKLFEEAIREKGWKQCPNCNVYIERNQGCDHMTCRNCKCNFCYVCGKYDQANPANRGDCGSSCTKPRK